MRLTLPLICFLTIALSCVNPTEVDKKDNPVEQIISSAKNQSDTIPIHLTNFNNILVCALINNTDTLDLMLHTAEGSVSIIKKVVDSLSMMQNSKAVGGIKSWGGDEGSSRYSTNNIIKVGLIEKDSLTIWETGLSGYFSAGKFGPNFFDGSIVEIDFDSSRLILHNKLPSKANQHSRFTIDIESGHLMFVSGKLGFGSDKVENKFLIHTGYGNRLLLDDDFVNEYDLNEKLKTLSEGQLKDSQGNVIITKKALLPSFEIGEHKFENVPISFFSGSIGRQKMSLIGGDLLKRFNIIIDLNGQQLFLKPNSNYTLPYSDT